LGSSKSAGGRQPHTRHPVKPLMSEANVLGSLMPVAESRSTTTGAEVQPPPSTPASPSGSSTNTPDVRLDGVDLLRALPRLHELRLLLQQLKQKATAGGP
jgi:hypothetical protein